MEVVMLVHGDDAGHCPNGSTAQNFRAVTAEERRIHQRWMRGTIIFYSTLFLISGVVAIVSYSSTSLTRLTNLSGHPTIPSLKTN
jgi:hypothetical protein